MLLEYGEVLRVHLLRVEEKLPYNIMVQRIDQPTYLLLSELW